MIWYILTIVAALAVSITPAVAVAYLMARLMVQGFGPDAKNATVSVFALVFAVVYVASAYTLIAWWVL